MDKILDLVARVMARAYRATITPVAQAYNRVFFPLELEAAIHHCEQLRAELMESYRVLTKLPLDCHGEEFDRAMARSDAAEKELETYEMIRMDRFGF
jgi:hypothetical protein